MTLRIIQGTFLCALLLGTMARTFREEYPGPYCERDGGHCCTDRKDDCSVPLAGIHTHLENAISEVLYVLLFAYFKIHYVIAISFVTE